MDDELGLLRDSEGSGGPERRPWVLVTGIVLVALLTLVGVGWMVSSVLDDGATVSAAAPTTTPPTPAPSTTPAAAPATTTAFPTALPTTTRPPAPTYSLPVVPVPSAVSVAPTTRRPAPMPTPRVTTPRATPPAGLRVVPDVVGLRVRSARVSLEAAGFRVSVLGGVFGSGRDNRRVTAQRPTPGTLARAGSTVVLVTDGL